MTSMPALQQATLPNVPVCWPALEGGELQEHLAELTEWITWVVWRYSLDHRSVPPCWPEHGALVEELSALQTAWSAAFAVTSGAEQPLRWHAEFAAARQRLGDWVARSGCRPGEHRPD
jgi:hypothetical protein